MQQLKLNREQRRALKKKKGKVSMSEETMRWEELNNLFSLCKDFLSVAVTIEQPLREVSGYIKNTDHFNGVMGRIVKDVEQLTAELNTIYSHHRDKIGEADEEDIMELFSFTQAYFTWMGRAKASLEPAYDELVDIHYKAQCAKAEAEGIDVSSVQPMPKLDLPAL